MRLLAKYTNDTDYGPGQSHEWNVVILGFVYGTLEDHSRRSGRHPDQPLAVCMFEDQTLQAVRLTQLRVLEERA